MFLLFILVVLSLARNSPQHEEHNLSLKKPCARYVGLDSVMCELSPGINVFVPYPLGTTCKRTGNICMPSSSRLQMERLHEEFVGNCRIGLYDGKYTCAIQKSTLVGSEKTNATIACLNLGNCDFYYIGKNVLKRTTNPVLKQEFKSCATYSTSLKHVICKKHGKPYIYLSNTRCVESKRDCLHFKNDYQTPVPVLLDNDVLQEEFHGSCVSYKLSCKKPGNVSFGEKVYYHVVCLEVKKKCSFYINSVPLIAIHGADYFISCLETTSEDANLVLCQSPQDNDIFVAYDLGTKCYMELGKCVGRNKSGHVLEPRKLPSIERLQHYFKNKCMVSNDKDPKCQIKPPSKNLRTVFRYRHKKSIVGCLYLKKSCFFSYIEKKQLHLVKLGSKIEKSCDAGIENYDYQLCYFGHDVLFVHKKAQACPFNDLACEAYSISGILGEKHSNNLLASYPKSCVLKTNSIKCDTKKFELTTGITTKGVNADHCICLETVGICKLHYYNYGWGEFKQYLLGDEHCSYAD